MLIGSHFLDELVQEQKKGNRLGIASICSAHPYVLRAAMQFAREQGSAVLVESTCNQVNQFGGYTGMTPQSFVSFVSNIAHKENLDLNQIYLGGDHLGPNVWQHESAREAMQKYQELRNSSRIEERELQETVKITPP